MRNLAPETLLATGALACYCVALIGAGFLMSKAPEPARVWLVDAEVEPLAMFGTLAACEADRQSLGITSDEYFCAEVK